MIGSMSYALGKYYLTRNHIIAGNVHAWVTPATVWPTFMLLAISIVTFIMDFFTLCTYCCGIGAANRTSTIASTIIYGMMVLRILAWAVAAGAFKMGSNASSLWTYSCSPFTDQIHDQVISFVDFGMLCTLQVRGRYSRRWQEPANTLVARILLYRDHRSGLLHLDILHRSLHLEESFK